MSWRLTIRAPLHRTVQCLACRRLGASGNATIQLNRLACHWVEPVAPVKRRGAEAPRSRACPDPGQRACRGRHARIIEGKGRKSRGPRRAGGYGWSARVACEVWRGLEPVAKATLPDAKPACRRAGVRRHCCRGAAADSAGGPAWPRRDPQLKQCSRRCSLVRHPCVARRDERHTRVVSQRRVGLSEIPAPQPISLFARRP